MSIRNAKNGKFTTEGFAAKHPAKTVKESIVEIRNFEKLHAKSRKTAAEELILQMIYMLHTHPSFLGMSSQQILDRMRELAK
jgi:hypothetical protein